ncbi:Flavodoxin reductases (ferredoxin-NADPH reductases) family 1 [Streptomyces venezuelae]|nr:ferric reductase-like transmembrane domain-containing protein [Streptomyces gardneri]WRK36870.1 ferric reductase-like transmembrane domain-containing protein [Streptomyces venezuelae]CUM41344.1 Flavodoxin reductases (ferredoxin-NADPH reductases) family 1 [Streptomyces venezuelae]
MTTEASHHPLYVPLPSQPAPAPAAVPPTPARVPASVPARAPAPVPALRLAPDRLRTGIVAGAGAVALLWGLQARPSARLDAFFATGAHLTGLLAGYGVLVLLLLMARVPAVEHGVGADRLARWHSRGGRYVLGLIGAHALLALCGYAVHTHTDLVTATGDLLSYGAIAAATAGTALLVAVGVTSARAVRRRVRHETWRAVHLSGLLAAALGFVHQLAGPDVAGSLVIVWLWSMAHATVGVLLVWYRIVVPVRAALRHDLRVAEVRDEGPGVVSVLVQGRGVARLCAEPGQFFRWRFLRRGLWATALPFSLSAPVRDDTLRITVKALGDHTRRIRRLRPGTRVLASGPFGALTAHRRTRRKVLLLAGGVGITPLRALFETLPGGPGDITLLYRASDEGGLVLREELETIARERQAALHYLLGPSDGSFDPLAPRALRELVPDLTAHDVYLCGPPAMARAATDSLSRAGVPASRIYSEDFDHG